MKPSASARASIAAMVAASAVALTSNLAAAFPYVVRRGDTVAELAERFYGRVELERVIVAANGLDQSRSAKIVPGMHLELPAVGYHKVSPGESWKTLASTLLGHPDRDAVLSQLNGSHPWAVPAIGREIVVPYSLRYVATLGDTTQSLAYRFLGKRDEGWLVASYNLLKRARLHQGEVLLVPISDLPLTDAGKQAAAAAGALIRGEAGGQARAAQQAADAQIPKLVEHVRRGRYLEAVVLGAGLLSHANLSKPQLAAIHAELTVAYVALGARGLAADACAAWRAEAPDLVLDPIDHSPKIIAVCIGAAGGEQDGGAP